MASVSDDNTTLSLADDVWAPCRADEKSLTLACHPGGVRSSIEGWSLATRACIARLRDNVQCVQE